MGFAVHLGVGIAQAVGWNSGPSEGSSLGRELSHADGIQAWCRGAPGSITGINIVISIVAIGVGVGVSGVYRRDAWRCRFRTSN